MSAAIAAPTRADVMAQAGRENFPVASRLLPERERRHLLALYGFARLVDDAGDEASGNRTALLDWIEADLDRVYAAEEPEHAVMRALVPTVRECSLPEAPFRRLIQANRRDQEQTRYASFDDLLGYCDLSAAPVGELVLHVFGAATPDRIALSDRICAGLQIVEHLQDVREDYERGRVYLPGEDMARFGCSESDLAAQAAAPALRALLAFEAGRARTLLAEGAPLATRLRLRPRLAVAGFVGGGRAALTGLARAGYEVLGSPAPLPKSAFAASFLKVVTGR